MTAGRAAPPAMARWPGCCPARSRRWACRRAGDPLGLAAELQGVRQIACCWWTAWAITCCRRGGALGAACSPTCSAGSCGHAAGTGGAFPSTTPTSLVTLGTGRHPGATASLGFTVQRAGARPGAHPHPLAHDPPPRQWQPLPRLLEQAPRQRDARPPSWPTPAFAGSGLTDAAYGAPRYVGRASPARATAPAMVAELARRHPARLRLPRRRRHRGAHARHRVVRSGGHAAREAGRLIAAVVEGLPDGAALLVTADHGGLDIDAGRPDRHRRRPRAARRGAGGRRRAAGALLAHARRRRGRESGPRGGRCSASRAEVWCRERGRGGRVVRADAGRASPPVSATSW